MESQANIKLNRRYDIDWIRIGLIASVFFFHIGMFFNGFGWHIKNNEEVAWLNPIMAYLHRWRMPLLFFVSGVGTYFALGKRNIGQYIRERSGRLLIPLLFGMFIIVPPQVFIEKHAQYGNYLNFIPHITEGSYPEGNFSWHHLWFVLYLFICSVAALPVILILRSRFSKRIYKYLERFFSVPGSFMILAVPLFLVQVFIRPYFPYETHALTDDWTYLSYNFLFFVFGYLIFSDKNLVHQLIKQRRIYGGIGLFMTLVFFVHYYYSIDKWVSDRAQLLLGAIFEWSVGIAIIGYGGKYLNKEHRWRKYLNEAIYPFYILHQTVIIVIGYHLINAPIGNGMKAAILTTASLFISIFIYMIIIRPFNVTRILFGMRTRKKPKETFAEINTCQKVA